MSHYKKPLHLALYETLVSQEYTPKTYCEIKGFSYEKQIGQMLEKKGFTVRYYGIEKGKRDDGIDIIAQSENHLILAQCKNHHHPIKQKEIRAFVGDVCLFLKKHPRYKDYTLSAHYYASNGFKKSAYHYKQNNKIYLNLELMYIKYSWEAPAKQRQLAFSF